MREWCESQVGSRSINIVRCAGQHRRWINIRAISYWHFNFLLARPVVVFMLGHKHIPLEGFKRSMHDRKNKERSTTVNLFELAINGTMGWRSSSASISSRCGRSCSVIDMMKGAMQFITVELIYLIGAKCMTRLVIHCGLSADAKRSRWHWDVDMLIARRRHRARRKKMSKCLCD